MFESVEAETLRELEAMGDAVSGALAASALQLAREMDDPDNSATSKSMCAARLLETMKVLRELAPPPVKEGKLDDISRARARRRADAQRLQRP